MTHPVLIAAGWIAFGAATIAIGLLALVGAKSLIKDLTFKSFLGSDATAAIPPWDMMVKDGKMAAVKDPEDFVVFLIGACVNNWWDFKGLAALSAMPKMLAELQANPSSGFLGGYSYGGTPLLQVQYWRSYEQLVAYARNPKSTHFPTWCKIRSYWAQAAKDGKKPGIGLYHETFRVRAGEYEAVYADMPAFGMGRIFGLVPAMGAYATSRGRVGITKGEDVPVFKN